MDQTVLTYWMDSIPEISSVVMGTQNIGIIITLIRKMLFFMRRRKKKKMTTKKLYTKDTPGGGTQQKYPTRLNEMIMFQGSIWSYQHSRVISKNRGSFVRSWSEKEIDDEFLNRKKLKQGLQFEKKWVAFSQSLQGVGFGFTDEPDGYFS